MNFVAELRPISAHPRKLNSSLFAGWAMLLVAGIALLSPMGATAQTNFINTVTGGATPGTVATSLDLPGPNAIAEDAGGNIYVTAPYSYYVYKITPSGTVSIFAGVGFAGSNTGKDGDGGPATAATLVLPSALAVDSSGDVYIADLNRVREVTTNGVITTVAGTGAACPLVNFTSQPCGDGGPATKALLNLPQGLLFDKFGNLYISDTGDNRIREVTAGTINTIVGTGHTCGRPTDFAFCGDDHKAILAQLDMPIGIAFDFSGDLIIADTRDQRLRCVIEVTGGCGGASYVVGVIVPFAGTGQVCPANTLACGDGLNPAAALFHNPSGIAYDAAGDLYIADQDDDRVREVTAGTNSIVTTATGSLTQGFCGDGGPPKDACLDFPYAVMVDSAGTVWVADSGNQRVRDVVSNIINTFAGGASGGDGGVPTAATLAEPVGVTWDSSGNYYIADTANNRIRKVTASSNTISTVAGTGSEGWSGDGASALLSGTLSSPSAVALDASGNLYIADTNNYSIRLVNTQAVPISVANVTVQPGDIATIAGMGPASQCIPTNGLCGDGGPGVDAQLVDPTSLALDNLGSLYIADYFGNRVRCLILESGGCGASTDAVGTILTTAGEGGPGGNTGDGGPATKAKLDHPWGIGTDAAGDLYISDSGNNRVRCVVESVGGCGGGTYAIGTIVHSAFTGTAGFGGDGGLASKAEVTQPLGLGFDPLGNLYVGGGSDSVVQRIDGTNFTIATVAGNPNQPTRASFCGDGALATLACLDNIGLSVNGSESLLIADARNNRIRGVNMVGVLSVNPVSLTFPPTTVGQKSAPQSFKFQNTGLADVTLGTFSLGGPDPTDFEIASGTCGTTLSPDLTCTETIVFTPQTTGKLTAYLKNSGSTDRLLLTGTGQ